jgi:adenosine/AMP kinase
MPGVEIEVVDVEKEEEDQVVVGMANFTIKTCDDLFRAVVSAVPEVEVGVAMNEAVPKLTRSTGNEERLEGLASRNALNIGASHAFVVVMRGAYPINVLNRIMTVPGVCSIIGSTANPCQVLVGTTGLGRAILGFVDGTAVESIEDEGGKKQRRDLVGKIGYPLG